MAEARSMANESTPAPAFRPRSRVRFGLLPKFLLTLSVLIAVISLSLSIYFLRVMSRRLVRDLEARGTYLVRSLAKTGQYGVFTSIPEILAPVAEGAFVDGDVVYVQIVDIEGAPLMTKERPGLAPDVIHPLDRAAVRRLSTADSHPVVHSSTSPPHYEFSYPVIIEKPGYTGDDIMLDEPAAPGRRTFERIGAVRVALSLESLNAELSRTQRQVVAITLSIAAAAFLLTVLSLRRIVGPITTLAEGARRISQGDFTVRAAVESHDEIGLLASAYNEMATRLESFQQGLERKVAERTEALAAKTRDMEEFVYTVSHDLKAPVVSTHGLVSLLAEEFGAELPPDARLYVDRIRANAGHMEKLIGDLFEMSRIDRPSKAREPVDVQKLVREVVLEHDAQMRAAAVEIVVQPDMPPAFAEPDRLTQVFENLIGNAIKFRKPDQPGHIAIRGRIEGSHTVHEVEDDGIGIDDRYHEKIFGLFQRLHSDREYPGTGLGLAIVKKIVEKHGGRIQIFSERGKGSTFSIYLPRAGAVQNQAS